MVLQTQTAENTRALST